MTSLPSFSKKDLIIFLSQIGLAVWVFLVFGVFRAFDWGHPFFKLGCFFNIFLIVLRLSKGESVTITSKKMHSISSVVFCLSLLSLLAFYSIKYFPYFSKPLGVDVAWTTKDAAILFFRHFQNPYSSLTLAVDTNYPGFVGFHYGPLMLVGYGLSAIFPNSGMRISNLFYLVISFIVISKLVSEKNADHRNLSGIIYALLIATIPEVVWIEMFQQGVGDVFPIMLLLLSFLFVGRENWLLAGLMAGLSFSAKPAPALFFIILFLRKNISIQFFKGVIIGFIPCLIFLAWDFTGIVKNCFLYAIVKNYDSTSLYDLTLSKIHFVFPLIQCLAMVFFIGRNYYRRIELKSVVVDFMLMLIIIEVTYKQMHSNHLLWFVFPLALICGWYRERSIELF